MSERPPRETEPLVLALAALIREVHAKRVEDASDRRAKMTLVGGVQRRRNVA
jgi:hypothetical protein